MTYQLYIGDRTFSSWSLRGWLMLEKFGLDYNTNIVGLYAGTYREELAHLAPARTVPAMQTPEGYVLTDSLAMGETLVERHPDVNLYPRDGAARALARTITHEMHSGFMALRDACPNMITHVWDGFEPSDAVLADVARVEELWALARSRHGQNGPWLFGDYSLADVFYAPVALRMTTYDLPASPTAQAYIDAHLSDPAFLAWRAASQSESYDPWPYPMDLGRKPWPGDES
ncbi:glutathione S-transferase [Yoonia sp. I 8.24]|uniref:glutathione S-transferase n=1 Tax=Yoonia sp. I 8.24 TaxID=1537229 RepID=UPI001EDD7AE7|nr:glutathione S-transferase [Yoonia sp. I 8.24]MCG3266790.1 glutathione S-transferase [Yoonia sp. I 8.24]